MNNNDLRHDGGEGEDTGMYSGLRPPLGSLAGNKFPGDSQSQHDRAEFLEIR